MLPVALRVIYSYTQSVTQETQEEATLSSMLAWRILCTEEPGGLWSIGLQRVGQD